MRVARFWARAQLDEAGYGRGAWGSSDTSPEDAQQRADAKARAMLAEVIERDDPGLHDYEYRHDLPEPIVQEIEDSSGQRVAAITINRYGANVLNTARLVFVDVDLPDRQETPGLLAKLFGKKKPPPSDPSAEALERLRAWSRENTSHGARVYRTAAGLRYLLTHPSMAPDGDDAGRLMQQLGADSLYARLCKAQQSFRARLSPKPWRIGFHGTPKLTFEKLADASEGVSDWLRKYEQACRGYAVCELVEEVGDTRPSDDNTARLIALHDDLAGVGSGRPLA